ncbi:MAG: hypothetical protein P1U36_09255 [Legionellaceae bacterium]|nr:hypothetical protein [Legionellaceae bacterium]
MFKVVRQVPSHLGRLSLFSPQTISNRAITSFTTAELRMKINGLFCEKEYIEDRIIKINAELNKRKLKDEELEPYHDGFDNHDNPYRDTGPAVPGDF